VDEIFKCHFGAVYDYAVYCGSNVLVLDEILQVKCDLTIQMKAIEQYFPLVLFVMFF